MNAQLGCAQWQDDMSGRESSESEYDECDEGELLEPGSVYSAEGLPARSHPPAPLAPVLGEGNPRLPSRSPPQPENAGREVRTAVTDLRQLE